MTSLNPIVALLRFVARPAAIREQLHNPSKIGKIKITRKNEIWLNKQQVSLDQMKLELHRLKQVNGKVWYYREQAQAYPTYAQQQVFMVIAASRLPIRLVEKDFE